MTRSTGAGDPTGSGAQPPEQQAPDQQPLDQQPVERLKRVGPRVRERLAKLGIRNVQDLLFHLPLRWQDRTRLVPLGELRAGAEAAVEGVVTDAQIAYGRRRSLKVWLGDGEPHGAGLLWRFFHFSPQQLEILRPGVWLRGFGEVRQGPNCLEMIHPEYRVRSEGEPAPQGGEHLTPIYPSTEGLLQHSLRGLIDQALDLMATRAPSELLPEDLLAGAGFPSLAEALVYLHHPPPDADLSALLERGHPAFRRLAFEELVAHQVSLRRLRQAHGRLHAPVLRGDGTLRRRFAESLPFRLTGDQERAIAEIAADLAASRPAQRMLQGDVGSGKTVVAAMAALQALECGRQAALMAPTELLSEQHWRGLCGWLRPLDIEPLWLTGRHKGREREALLAAIAGGEARLVIGTHALIQDEVAFADLGLVIIDEQHRFGVHQRMRLREKGSESGQTCR